MNEKEVEKMRGMLDEIFQFAGICKGRGKIKLLMAIKNDPGLLMVQYVKIIEGGTQKSPQYHKSKRILLKYGMITLKNKGLIITQKGLKLLEMFRVIAETPAKEPIMGFKYDW